MTASNSNTAQAPGAEITQSSSLGWRARHNLKAGLRNRAGDVRRSLDDAHRIVAKQLNNGGRQPWPTVPFAQIVEGDVPDDTMGAIRRHGCVVITTTFPAATAHRWADELRAEAERRDATEDPAVNESRGGFMQLFWSGPQLEARTHPNMDVVRLYLNSFWSAESNGRRWFDPSTDTHYPDRVRRRPAGTAVAPLPAHIDNGSVERWLSPAYRRVYRQVFDGRLEDYDPWDAAWRPLAEEVPSPVHCSVFRSFQGWVALGRLASDHGVLHVVPSPNAIAAVLLRALQADVDDADLCGATAGTPLTLDPTWHADLLDALVPLPPIEPGDSVWWHPDLVHSVAGHPAQPSDFAQLYIPVTPGCARNERYAGVCRTAQTHGKAPPDFPPD